LSRQAPYTEAGLDNGGRSLTIRGQDQNNTIVQAAASPGVATDRVFLVTGGRLVLERMTIRYGNVLGDGGGVRGGGDGATLKNCTITGNSAYWFGGGVYSCVLSNCVLSGNSAMGAGGAYDSMLYNCAVIGCSSASNGGGAVRSTLYNCTVTGNSGGAVSSCRAYNCILWQNSAPLRSDNYDPWSTLEYCCTTPRADGVGNIMADPELASGSHISAASPCRGRGSASYARGDGH